MDLNILGCGQWTNGVLGLSGASEMKGHGQVIPDDLFTNCWLPCQQRKWGETERIYTCR